MAAKDDPETSVTFKSATVKNMSMRKGEVIVFFSAPIDEANATIGDLSDLTSGAFKGTVTIRGKQAQLALEIPDRPPKA